MVYDPWRDAGERHAEVVIARTDCRPALGAWIESAQVILLERTLERPERNFVLAHEIAHIDLGHKVTGHGWFDRRQERQADDLAARRMITVKSLAAAIRVSLCEEEVAEELGVTLEVAQRRMALLTDQEKDFIYEQLWGRTA